MFQGNEVHYSVEFDFDSEKINSNAQRIMSERDFFDQQMISFAQIQPKPKLSI